jgi:hypothetical protein
LAGIFLDPDFGASAALKQVWCSACVGPLCLLSLSYQITKKSTLSACLVRVPVRRDGGKTGAAKAG